MAEALPPRPPDQFRRNIATTTGTNILSTLAAGVTGVLIARSIGSEARGEYASVMAWFGVTLTIGELGQTAATTYFVAKDQGNARTYVATSRNLMVLSGLATLLAGIAFAPALANGNDGLAFSYRFMFATCIFSYVGASLTFSLQATATLKWNLVRLFQPLAFTLAVWWLHFAGKLTILTCLYAISLTILLQTILAYGLCRTNKLTGGSGSRFVAKTMTRYGLSQVAASIPSVIVSRLDVLALSLSVEPKVVGHYAVATSLTGLAAPAVSAIGAVTFPRIALQHEHDAAGTRRLKQKVILLTATASSLVALLLMISAQWLVPLMFGTEYRQAVPLVWALAPAGALLACVQVCSDVLRGYGRPITVAKVQWMAAIVTAVAMAALLPTIGVVGAALAMIISSCVSLTLLLINLRK